MMSSGFSLSLQLEVVYQSIYFSPASVWNGSLTILGYVHLDRPPVGPIPGAGFTYLRKAVSSAAHLHLHRGLLTYQCHGAPSTQVEGPTHSGQLPCIMAGHPLPTSARSPSSAYPLLDALGDGTVPGADDGLRVMLDQVF